MKKMDMTICPGCNNTVPAEDMTAVNDDGVKVCPRCVFVLALYLTGGIRKTFSPGGLMPNRLNARFRKILDEEFAKDPKKTYEKYLGSMIKKEEIRLGIVNVESKVIDGLKDFPFVLLPMEYEAFQPDAGKVLTLKCGNKEVKRKIYASHKMPLRAAKKYGAKSKAIACFLPETF